MSNRQLDYKYLEYNLFLILYKFEDYDFSTLGMPIKLDIVTYPFENDYNIYTRTHVTLNAELYKLYEVGYFKNLEEFIDYVALVIYKYDSKKVTIKTLVKIIRNTMLKFIKTR